MDLVHVLEESFSTHEHRLAASMAGSSITYGRLWEKAQRLSDIFLGFPDAPVGLFVNRGFPALAAFLASVASGRPYVPLNPKFPDERLREIIQRSGCSAVVADEACHERVQELSEQVSGQEVATEWVDLSSDRVAIQRLGNPGGNEKVNASKYAYLMFTSGSTGHPKGIAISRANLGAYLEHATSAFGMEPGSRASQLFDFSFDLSVHDLFVTWLCGGELCLPAPGDVLLPGKYIERHQLTHWFSVPSVALIMRQLGMVKPDAYPSICQSLFCGEALPESIAAEWGQAAPNSSIWNLYGPTEATIAFTAYEWREENAADSSGVVPIGEPFPGQNIRVDHAEGDSVGELYLGGSQVAEGYLDQPEPGIVSAFGEIPGEPGTVWYRTGDLVEQSDTGTLLFRGRVDSQVQIMGHRVELSEVESAVRSETKGAAVAALAVPGESGNLEEIIAFVESESVNPEEIKQRCAVKLPSYMVPKRIIGVGRFPLNANGKIDRKSLQEKHYE